MEIMRTTQILVGSLLVENVTSKEMLAKKKTTAPILSVSWPFAVKKCSGESDRWKICLSPGRALWSGHLQGHAVRV
jgi:hypothetical protein